VQTLVPGAGADQVLIPRRANHRSHRHRHSSCSEGASACTTFSLGLAMLTISDLNMDPIELWEIKIRTFPKPYIIDYALLVLNDVLGRTGMWRYLCDYRNVRILSSLTLNNLVSLVSLF
jgi:hypothetical protein